MTTTTFVNTVTPVVAPWLNDVNNLVYGNAGNAVRSSTGNWTIPAPSAGIALSVTGLISTSAAIASRTDGNTLTVGLLTQNTTVGAGAGSYVLVTTDSTSAGALASYGTAHSSFPNATRLFTTSTGNLSIGVNQLDVITLNGTTRGVTIAAPSSGNTLIVNSVAGASALYVSSNNALRGFITKITDFATIYLNGNLANVTQNGIGFSSGSGGGAGIGFSRGVGFDTFIQFYTNDVGNTVSDGATLRGGWSSDGRFYGTALHNNSGAVTGTTSQFIASGTYTPTGTNGSNVTANSPFSAKWIRVGNVVHVVGRTSVTTTTAASTASMLDLSLPIASNLAAVNDCCGAGASFSGEPIAIEGNFTNDRASLEWLSLVTGSHTINYTFSYEVL
jgi:hypothetical protein